MEAVTASSGARSKRGSAVWAAIIGVIYALLTIWILPYYYGGDQAQYALFYESSTGMGWQDSYEYYQSVLGAREPIYFILVKLAAPIIDRIYLSAVINGLMAGLIYHYFSAVGASRFLQFIFSINFYFLVLLFAAERLKLGFLILGLAFLLGGRSRVILMGMSVFAHSQMGLLVVGFYLAWVAKDLGAPASVQFVRKLPNYLLVLGMLWMIVQYQGSHIDAKVQAYLGNGGVEDVLKVAVFLVLAVVLAKGKSEPILVGFPSMLAAYYLGSERIAMLTYIIFLYYGLRKRGGLNVLTLVATTYFAWKGALFLYNVITFGNGFSE